MHLKQCSQNLTSLLQQDQPARHPASPPKDIESGTDELDLEFYTLELAPKQEDMTWAGTS